MILDQISKFCLLCTILLKYFDDDFLKISRSYKTFDYWKYPYLNFLRKIQALAWVSLGLLNFLDLEKF